MLKYINTIDSGFIIFTGVLTHDQMWRKMKKSEDDELLSAGFVSINTSNLECCGESISLKVGSNPEDTEKLLTAITWF